MGGANSGTAHFSLFLTAYLFTFVRKCVKMDKIMSK